MTIINKVCAYCDKEFSFEDYNNGTKRRRSYCSETCFTKGVRRKNFLTHIDARREHVRRISYWKHYKITLEEYDAMLKKQNGVCAICHLPPKGTKWLFHLQPDHNHLTGEMRELLCGDCNQAVGRLKDNPVLARRVAEYLEKHNE